MLLLSMASVVSRCTLQTRILRQNPIHSFKFTTKTPTTETWPDGTPKKYQGKETWKNWINYDTEHNNLTDQLNRLRHFFWEVDAHGKLWRLEIDELDKNGKIVGTPRRCGQMREAKILDFFFPKLKLNDSEMYSEDFPFLVRRAHEMYYCRTKWDPSNSKSYPIVFNNLVNTNTVLQHSCPGSGHVVKRIDTLFDPSKLRVDTEGRLFHPVVSTLKISTSGNIKYLVPTDSGDGKDSADDNVGGKHGGTGRSVRWGLLESVLAQSIATEIGEMDINEESMELTLKWNDVSYKVEKL